MSRYEVKKQGGAEPWKVLDTIAEAEVESFRTKKEATALLAALNNEDTRPSEKVVAVMAARQRKSIGTKAAPMPEYADAALARRNFRDLARRAPTTTARDFWQQKAEAVK